MSFVKLSAEGPRPNHSQFFSPQTQAIELHKTHLSPDFKALKLRNIQSGRARGQMKTYNTFFIDIKEREVPRE